MGLATYDGGKMSHLEMRLNERVLAQSHTKMRLRIRMKGIQ